MEQTQRTSKTVVRFETADEGVVLKNLFERLQRFVDVCLEFRPSGISMTALSANSLSLVQLRLNQLDNYYCRIPDNMDENVNAMATNMGIDVSTWFKLFKKVGHDDIVVLRIDEDGYSAPIPHGTLFVYNKTNDILIEYEVPFLDIEPCENSAGDRQFDTVITVPSEVLYRVLRCCESGGEAVRLYTEKRQEDQQFRLVIETDAASQSEVRGTVVKVFMKVGAQTECLIPRSNILYRLDTLLEMSRSFSMNTAGDCLISLALSPAPVVIDYDVGTLGKLRYCLAPLYLENDDLVETAQVEVQVRRPLPTREIDADDLLHRDENDHEKGGDGDKDGDDNAMDD